MGLKEWSVNCARVEWLNWRISGLKKERRIVDKVSFAGGVCRLLLG
jgi:hypothetical protein